MSQILFYISDLRFGVLWLIWSRRAFVMCEVTNQYTG